MKKYILASKSPRRRELLSLLGISFEVQVSGEEEIITSSEPAVVTEELAEQKAKTVAAKVESGIVIGADTVVALDGEILGKPEDRKEAGEMLRMLQSNHHMVYTGVCVTDAQSEKTICFHVGTKVYVAPMTEQEISDYLDTGEPYDKAGGYGIQGEFARFIEKIEGDYFNVVGLPVHALYEVLREF